MKFECVTLISNTWSRIFSMGSRMSIATLYHRYLVLYTYTSMLICYFDRGCFLLLKYLISMAIHVQCVTFSVGIGYNISPVFQWFMNVQCGTLISTLVCFHFKERGGGQTFSTSFWMRFSQAPLCLVWFGYWCFTSHATIFQSYMWRHRCAGGLKKKLKLSLSIQSHFRWHYLFTFGQ